jgi:hypothetical protein
MDLLIKVLEQPCLPIINRDEAVELVNHQLAPWLKLVADMVNYGSALIPRTFGSSEKTLGDAVVIGVLLRQVVAMFDALEVLMSNGAVHASNVQLRAMFEASVYIQWILAGEKDKKARYYYVFNLLRKRMWALRVQPESQEGKAFRAVMAKAGLPVDESLGSVGKSQIAEIDRVLSQPEFAAASADFHLWKKHNARKPSWYSPLGVANLRDLAERVGKEPIYAMVYASTSEVMHASSYEHHIRIREGKLTIEPIRYFGRFAEVFRFSTIIAMDVFMAVLRAYRPGEMRVFGNKYLEKWQKFFLNPPRIDITAKQVAL